jgi:hypothetical protein
MDDKPEQTPLGRAFSLPDFIAAALRRHPAQTSAGRLGETVAGYMENSPELVISALLLASDPDPGELIVLYEAVSSAEARGKAAQVLRIALAIASRAPSHS